MFFCSSSLLRANPINTNPPILFFLSHLCNAYPYPIHIFFTLLGHLFFLPRTATHLHRLHDRFDRLCELTGCEKIATLGDCYYCVAGCPNPVLDHAERTVEMGRAMCQAIQQFDQDHQEEVGSEREERQKVCTS
ncbi:unnamed protein product [Protopolystoma xenopodis]|uniref:adenylate cyclase n=1 Tax=Protopolystoma xenopodis TaxID=117903 RepID=A0A3S5CSF6_9PLAT|nr:unnamed protein product [Protopolystoma xenopodis]